MDFDSADAVESEETEETDTESHRLKQIPVRPGLAGIKLRSPLSTYWRGKIR